MARLACVLWVLLTVTAAQAAETPEARLRHLVRRAVDGDLTDLASDLTNYAARPLGHQLILMTGTGALVTLIDHGDASPLKAKLPAAAWPRLVAARATLDPVAKSMSRTNHEVVLAALAKKELLPARVHVGTANLYLRYVNEEAETLLQQAEFVAIARRAIDVVAQDDVQQAVLALSVDPSAPAEVRQHAGHLHPLIAQTAAAVRVAELRLLQALGR